MSCRCQSPTYRAQAVFGHDYRPAVVNRRVLTLQVPTLSITCGAYRHPTGAPSNSYRQHPDRIACLYNPTGQFQILIRH